MYIMTTNCAIKGTLSNMQKVQSVNSNEHNV
jgi:hypothetical protein